MKKKKKNVAIFPNYVTLDTLLNFSVPQFPYL